MGKAFFIFDPQAISTSGAAQHRDDKIIPDPVAMETNYPIIDGKVEEITATSGVLQYLIVQPGDYPLTQNEREMRGTMTRK